MTKKSKKKSQNFENNITNTNQSYSFSRFFKTKFLLPSGIVALLLLIVIVVFASKAKDVNLKEFDEAVSQLNKELDGKLGNKWFEQIDWDDSIPEKRIYAELDSLKIIFKKNNKDSVVVNFEKVNNFDAAVKVSVDHTRRLTSEIMSADEWFKLEDDMSELDTMASKINALTKYCKDVDSAAKATNMSRCDIFLSLVYNSLVGDDNGHAAVTVSDGQLDYIRFDDFNFVCLDVNKFCDMVKAIQERRIDGSDVTLLQQMLKDGVIDTSWCPEIAYFDRRNDRILAGSVVVVDNNKQEKFTRLARAIKAKPDQILVYDGAADSIMPLEQQMATKKELLIGTLDLESVNAIHFSNHGNKFKYLILNVLCFFVGLFVFPAISSLRKRNRVVAESTKASSGKSYETENRQAYSNNSEILSSARNEGGAEELHYGESIDSIEMVSQDEKKMEEENPKLVGSSNVLQSDKKDLQKKFKKTEYLLSMNGFSLENLIEAIGDDWQNSRKVLSDAIKKHDKYVENQFVSSKEYQDMKQKSDYFDKLSSCKKESKLIEMLEEMRKKTGNRMAHINTFADLKGDAKPDNSYDTLKNVVSKFDQAMDTNLSSVLDTHKNNSDWYTKYNASIVQPSLTFVKNATSLSNDNHAFVAQALTALLKPMLGEKWNEYLDKTVSSLDLSSRKSKVYDILQDARKSKPETSQMLSQLSLLKLDDDGVRYVVALYERARLFTAAKHYNEAMYNTFVKDFLAKEPTISDASSAQDKAWFFTMLFNIAYHSADHILSQVSPADEMIGCFNKKYFESGFNSNSGFVRRFVYDTPVNSTKHADAVYSWAKELGITQLKVLVDNFVIMP